MLSLARPGVPANFTTLAAKRLTAVETLVIRDGEVCAEHFTGQELWREPRFKGVLKVARRARCGFCEQGRALSHELDVEHYRPKSEVSVWDGSPSIVLDHPPPRRRVCAGYWWLAYAWENYALACKVCNQKWKRDLFPVVGVHPSYGVGMEAGERPLLLHPFEPFKLGEHLRWDELGYLHPVTDRGYATIVTCGLNREDLVAARRMLWNDVERALCSIDEHLDADRWEKAEPLLTWIERRGANSSDFAGMVRWRVERWLGDRWDTRFADDVLCNPPAKHGW